jgi:hypothetical protein
MAAYGRTEAVPNRERPAAKLRHFKNPPKILGLSKKIKKICEW